MWSACGSPLSSLKSAAGFTEWVSVSADGMGEVGSRVEGGGEVTVYPGGPPMSEPAVRQTGQWMAAEEGLKSVQSKMGAHP